MLQRVAVYCSVLQCVAIVLQLFCDCRASLARLDLFVSYSVLQCVAVCCSVLQFIAAVLQCVAVVLQLCCDCGAACASFNLLMSALACCSVLQCVCVCCSCVAGCCSECQCVPHECFITLQRVAVCFSVLQLRCRVLQ